MEAASCCEAMPHWMTDGDLKTDGERKGGDG